MKFGRFQHQSRTFFGLVEGDRVDELDGSPFGNWKTNGKTHALSALKILTPCEPRNFYCAGLELKRQARYSRGSLDRSCLAPLIPALIPAKCLRHSLPE